MIERRFLPTELRVLDDSPLRIVGYAAIFNSLSQDLGGFREQIAPGAFADALKKDDIRCLFNHDTNMILGRMAAGTLRMKEDEKGLHYENDLPDTHVGQHVRSAVARKDITGNSFGFKLRNKDGEHWERQKNGEMFRTLMSIRLFEIGPVTYAAYTETSVDVREVREMYAERIKAADAPKIIVDMAACRIRQWIAEKK